MTLLTGTGVHAQVTTNSERGHIVRKLLSDTRHKTTTWKGEQEGSKEPEYGGQPLRKLLRNKHSSGTNELTLNEMFTLKQIITGEEPEIVTYQLPISHDAITGIRSPTNGFPNAYLMLLMDSDPDENFLNEPKLKEINRATNGDCLLVWNTAFERPGQHAMQALLRIEVGFDNELEIKGPVKPYFSSNLCQFYPASSLWNDTSAYIDAYNLVESNAVCSIEIKTKAGAHLKTLTGKTTNGVIQVDWDLLDDHGRKYTNNSFVSHFHITLPGSGRSQILKQPQNKLGTAAN